MSIQASWNRMVGSAAALTSIAKMGKMMGGKAPEVDYSKMSPEELAAARAEQNDPKMDEAINGIQARLSGQYGVSEEDAKRLSDEIRMGRGEGWTNRFIEAQAAAKKAREAAAEENNKPRNNVKSAEDAVKYLQELQKQSQGGNT